ncbi:hypothetical protein H310_01774 [Aphanomyces invadans]|uniref:FYVE-type domain-containing protein n=1 Tax=Aphanomyces invadans TaxID=157072 RepID=A0A024ULT2_9STRA|nr:hypothetical protein H310_01774 [Aphanomyces invadans]ETW07145.1 hypothetical protein H310_01774 [Aphanomyces invadans]|eukprot:XP_008863238.1 hypothetical protein H310_01774 [Aphanomyces invadans]
MGRKSPLPGDFFRRPALGDAARAEYIRRGQAALVDLIEKTRLLGGPIEWTRVHTSSGGVTTYRGVDPGTQATVFLRVKSDIDASLDEAAFLFRPPRQYDHTYLREFVVDSQTLYTVATPSRQHPHNSIRLQWLAIDPKLVGIRDFCVLEYQDDFVREGVRGFGRCFHSVDLPAVCPDLQATCGYTRATLIFGGDIFIENIHRPGTLTLFRLFHQDMKGRGQWFLAWAGQRMLSRQVAVAADHLRLERQSQPAFATSSTSMSQRHSSHVQDEAPRSTRRTRCSVCQTRFFLVFGSAKYTCAQCGQIVCKYCHVAGSLRQPSNSTPLARVCTLCSTKSKTQRDSHALQVSWTTHAMSHSQRSSTHRPPGSASLASSMRFSQPRSESNLVHDPSAPVMSRPPSSVRSSSHPPLSLGRSQSARSREVAPRVDSIDSTESRRSPANHVNEATPCALPTDEERDDIDDLDAMPLLDATPTMHAAAADGGVRDGESSVVSSFVVVDVYHNPPSPHLCALIQHLQARDNSCGDFLAPDLPPSSNILGHAKDDARDMASPNDFASDAATIATDYGEVGGR